MLSTDTFKAAIDQSSRLVSPLDSVRPRSRHGSLHCPWRHLPCALPGTHPPPLFLSKCICWWVNDTHPTLCMCVRQHLLSLINAQARASLKNPSRPYTPRSTARPLFHGDDYRPGSRPSSSYTVTEQKELQRKQSTDDKRERASPSASMLPPRSSAPGRMKKKSSSTSGSSSSPEDPDSFVAMTSSASQLKLVHAPIIPYEDEERAATTTSQHNIYKHDAADNSDADSDTRCDDEDDHLEASLELPSQVRKHSSFSC